MQAIRNFVDAILYPFRMLAHIPSSVISSPRRLFGLSLQARSALLLFFALLLILIVWVIVRWLQSAEAALQPWVFFRDNVVVPIILLIVIPLIVWYALKLWLEGEPSPYPEIDRVWKAALAAMKEQAIDPSETPIFMIFGPSSADAANAFLSASNVQFPVKVPRGPAPAHVYANQQSIYVVCTESCCLGQLLSGGATLNAATPVPAAGVPYDPTKTMHVDGLGEAPSAAPPEASQPPADRLGLGDVNVPGGISSAPSAMQGTMLVGGSGEFGARPTAPPAPAPRLNPGQSGEATEKLAYLCRCIRRVRDPLCPINGVLVTTPFSLLADGPEAAVNQLQTALKADLAALRGETRVRCSVTHLVVGMEEEAGFRELIRRVGTDRASTQRFGKGFGLWNPPITEQLDGLVKHACGAFEDWSYLLFREDDGLSKRGNRHLYGLLCRIRMKFQPRLQNLIKNSYSIDRNAPSVANREPLLFSGCYFIANGTTPDHQAFLGSVFRKTQDEEEELEWGSEAVNEEKRMQAGVQVLLVINGILVASIVAMLVYSQLNKS